MCVASTVRATILAIVLATTLPSMALAHGHEDRGEQAEIHERSDGDHRAGDHDDQNHGDRSHSSDRGQHDNDSGDHHNEDGDQRGQVDVNHPDDHAGGNAGGSNNAISSGSGGSNNAISSGSGGGNHATSSGDGGSLGNGGSASNAGSGARGNSPGGNSGASSGNAGGPGIGGSYAGGGASDSNASGHDNRISICHVENGLVLPRKTSDPKAQYLPRVRPDDLSSDFLPDPALGCGPTL